MPHEYDAAILDAAYERFHDTGPEFEGWLSNHGPMASDALIRLGRADAVEGWVHGYATRLEEVPRPRRGIGDEWRQSLGDVSRLGDWLDHFARETQELDWRDLLATWWPRLLPGASAAATHGLIRTGHAVRALLEVENPLRVDELAQALGYWAARWVPLPGALAPHGQLTPGSALEETPATGVPGDFRTRIAALAATPAWPEAAAALQPVPDFIDIPAAFDALTDAAVDHYLRWGHGDPIMMVHAATAPRAASLVLPAIPRALWVRTYDMVWATAAAIASMYRPRSPFAGALTAHASTR